MSHSQSIFLSKGKRRQKVMGMVNKLCKVGEHFWEREREKKKRL